VVPGLAVREHAHVVAEQRDPAEGVELVSGDAAGLEEIAGAVPDVEVEVEGPTRGRLAPQLLPGLLNKIIAARALAPLQGGVLAQVLVVAASVRIDQHAELVVRLLQDIRGVDALEVGELQAAEVNAEAGLVFPQRALQPAKRLVDLAHELLAPG